MTDAARPTPAPGKTAVETIPDHGAAPAGDTPDVVTFRHAFFHRVDDIHFRIDDATRQPVACVRLGDGLVSLPLEGIRREFQIDPEGPDGRMLALLSKSLKFVKGLRLGDPVPKEVTSGDASWSPKDKHRQIAYHRLAMQVLGWLSGDEHVITNPDELLQVAGDPTFRKRVNDAFGEVAHALGLQTKEEVTELIQGLSQELAYIEALRDEFLAIKRMQRKTEVLRKIYANEHSLLEVANSLIRLVALAVEDLEDQFETVDAQTGEIMAALKNLDTVRHYLREHRNDLRVRLLAWEDILIKWLEHPMKAGRETEDLIAETYRFLAPRYMPVDEWVMMTRLKESRQGQAPKALRIRKDKEIKYIGGRMTWS